MNEQSGESPDTDRSIYVEDANGTVYLARPVARIVDQPLGVGADWLVNYDDDPTMDDGTLLYVLDLHGPSDG